MAAIAADSLRQLGGAASVLLGELFAGPPVLLRLTVCSSTALHFVTGDDRVPLVSVVPADGVRLPGGVLCGEAGGVGPRWSLVRAAGERAAGARTPPGTTPPWTTPPWSAPLVRAAGERAAGGRTAPESSRFDRAAFDRAASARGPSIGGGVLRLGEVSVRPVRWWGGATAPRSALVPAAPVARRPTRTPDVPTCGAALTALRDVVGRVGARPDRATAAATERLREAIGHDAAAAAAAARAMVGLGPGLTPAADDVLVGALLTLHHPAARTHSPVDGRAARARAALSAAAADAGRRTTAVSAALLSHAARGEGMPVLLHLLEWADSAGDPDLGRAATEEVARVGHDTGPALLHGVVLAAGFVLADLGVTIRA